MDMSIFLYKVELSFAVVIRAADISALGNGLVGFRADGRLRRSAVGDAVLAKTGSEPFDFHRLNTDRIDSAGPMILGEADHALHRSERLLAEVP